MGEHRASKRGPWFPRIKAWNQLRTTKRLARQARRTGPTRRVRDMTRHEFLVALHDLVRPETYFEIGVQFGVSLALAEAAVHATGVDPNPLLNFAPANQRPNQQVFPMTSDQFFADRWWTLPPVDLAFIDGMHLYEYALRDFIHTEQRMADKGIIVFDDVLPYNQAIAEREQPPGDWTGDVWKVYPLLGRLRPELDIFLVDTFPTGTMLVLNPNPIYAWEYPIPQWTEGDEVPQYILQRTAALTPEQALEKVKETR